MMIKWQIKVILRAMIFALLLDKKEIVICKLPNRLIRVIIKLRSILQKKG